MSECYRAFGWLNSSCAQDKQMPNVTVTLQQKKVQQCCHRSHLGARSPISCLQEVIHLFPFVCLVSVWQSESDSLKHSLLFFSFLFLSASSYHGEVFFRAPAVASWVFLVIFSHYYITAALSQLSADLTKYLMVCKVKSEYQIIPSACNLSSNLNSHFPAANLEIHLVEIVQLHVHILRIIYSLNGKIKAFKSTICSLNSMAQKCNVILSWWRSLHIPIRYLAGFTPGITKLQSALTNK